MKKYKDRLATVKAELVKSESVDVVYNGINLFTFVKSEFDDNFSDIEDNVDVFLYYTIEQDRIKFSVVFEYGDTTITKNLKKEDIKNFGLDWFSIFSDILRSFVRKGISIEKDKIS